MARQRAAGTPPKLDLSKPVYLKDGDGTQYFAGHFPDGTPIIDDDGDVRLFTRDVKEWDAIREEYLTNVRPPWTHEFRHGGVDYIVSSQNGKLAVNTK